MSVEEQRAKPPEPPQVHRRVRLHRFQWVGVPVLLVLPVVLALFGMFGESWDTARLEGGTIAATVEWPSRFRYKQLNEIRVRVENRSRSVLDTVDVSVDTAYANGFSTVRAIPSFEHPFSLPLELPWKSCCASRSSTSS